MGPSINPSLFDMHSEDHQNPRFFKEATKIILRYSGEQGVGDTHMCLEMRTCHHEITVLNRESVKGPLKLNREERKPGKTNIGPMAAVTKDHTVKNSARVLWDAPHDW